MIMPHVSSAVAYDGPPPAPASADMITPRLVHAARSTWGNTPTWLMIRRRSSRSSSGARIGVRSRIRHSASVSARRLARTSTSLVWSFQILTWWPTTFAKARQRADRVLPVVQDGDVHGREPSTAARGLLLGSGILPLTEEAITMRSLVSRMWPAAVVLALVLLAHAGPAVPTAEAQAGGTLVIGLDQEPPDARSPRLALGGHLPDHRLGDREPPLSRARREARAVARRVVDRGGRRPERHLQAPPGRQVPRRHALQRRRGEVQLRPDRGSQLQGRRARGPSWPVTRSPRCSTSTRCRSASRLPYAPFVTYAAAGTLSLVSPKAVRETGRPGPHAARRHRPVHGQGVRRQGPRDDRPQPRLHAEGAVERPQPGPPTSTPSSGSSSRRRGPA